MNAVPLVIVAVVMSLGMQPAPKPAPPPQPMKPVTLNVEIVVGAQENLAATAAALAVAEQLAPMRRQQRQVDVVGNGYQHVGVIRLGFAGR